MLVVLGTAISRRRRSTARTTRSRTLGNHAIRLRRAPASTQPRPLPRKVARRMKLEKYASKRTYAGIQRISATSRNRTRKDERKSVIAKGGWVDRPRQTDSRLAVRPESQLSYDRFRAAVPLGHDDVPLILQIRDADAARPESACRQIAETAEEGDRVSKAGVAVRRIRDLVEQLP